MKRFGNPQISAEVLGLDSEVGDDAPFWGLVISRYTDKFIFLIQLKGGQETRAFFHIREY